MPILFALTLFVSALLMFMVQPMIGRLIIPLLGGSPAAWNTCMVFFQFMLLLGYLYAHKLCGRLQPKQQVAVHLGVLFLAMITFGMAATLGQRGTPIAIVKSFAPQDTAYPMFDVMALLAVAIGIPFFAVSASAPLLQKWFANTDHPAAKDPYFLYAASNLGSLISLLVYPLITEPSLTLKQQTWLFAGGFVALAALVFLCGRTALARPHPTVAEDLSLAANGTDAPTWGRILKWVAYAFVPSSLMLGVTFFMTTDIASIPLLWVIPLALYLLTFIIAFMRTPAWFRVVLGNLAPVVTLLLIFFIVTQSALLDSAFLLIALHLTAFFLLALMCHTELAHDRPPARYLTNFYLWISVGGVLGGIFNALIAPMCFPLAFEYPIALTLGCMLVPKLTDDRAKTKDQIGRARMYDIFIPFLMLCGVAWLNVLASDTWMTNTCFWISTNLLRAFQWLGLGFFLDPGKVQDLLIWALPLVLCFLSIDRPLRFGLCVAAVFGVGEYRRAQVEFHTERSFFGILKVRDHPQPPKSPMLRHLVHGTTLHGKQALNAWPYYVDLNPHAVGALVGPGLVFGFDWRDEPLTYYHRTGPVGHAFAVARERNPKPKVGMVGLGTGSVACYADKDLALTFYEIDPIVKALVADRKRDAEFRRRNKQNVDREGNRIFDPKHDPFFTYVIDAEERGATVDFVLGDARLKLEETPDKKFDLLLIDAFSSDSIPIHLLTKEAVEMYANHLTPDGLLALHISNKYVKLEYVVDRIAENLGLSALVFNDSWTEKDDHKDPYNQLSPFGKTQSQWVILARDPKLIETFKEARFTTQYRYAAPLLDENGKVKPRDPPPINLWTPLARHPDVKVWTDDYADVLMVMMLKEVQWMRKKLGLPHLGDQDTR